MAGSPTLFFIIASLDSFICGFDNDINYWSQFNNFKKETVKTTKAHHLYKKLNPIMELQGVKNYRNC